MRFFTFKKVAPREQPFTSSISVQNRMAVSASNVISNPADSKITASDLNTGEILNGLIVIHLRAVSALKTNGWRNNGDFWKLPGNDIKETCYAKYYIDPIAGRYKFINCSTSGLPFQVKGYTDVQVICELEFDRRIDKCIQSLSHEYLNC